MIKNILLPTDFSTCASFAAKAAAMFAQKYQAKLHIVSATNFPKKTDTSQNQAGEEDAAFKREVKKTDILLKELADDLKTSHPNIVFSQIYGTLIESIIDYVEKNQIDLVVMGSHGISGKNEFFIGSNTQKVVRKIHVPVLVIKNPVESVDFKKVVFASTFNLNDKPVFQKLIDLVKQDQPEIHLVMVNTPGWFSQPYTLSKEVMEDFKELCLPPLKCQIHFYRDLNVDAGIRHLSDDIKADLITISNIERHPIKRIFSGSSVEALVNHSEIPVLSIDLKQKG